MPYLPAGLFKTHELRSISREHVFKTLTSSGTTGQAVSRIYLDRDAARAQTSALASIMTHFLGPERLPMILVDTRAVIGDRASFSARGAGLVGMMNFGREHFYALNERMELDEAGLRAFLERFGGKPFLLFGFTFMVWQYLVQPLAGRGIDLSNGTLIHSGGWKRLTEQAVTSAGFKARLLEATGLRRSHNFYGMVEQTGSVFMECDDGWLHPPSFSDVVIRDPVTWEEQPVGRAGVVQVLSVLPTSYPGHSILTEDWGVVHAIDGAAPGQGVRGDRARAQGRAPRLQRHPRGGGVGLVKVRQLVPAPGEVELDDLLGRLAAPPRHAGFSDAVLELCATFSTLLFKDPEARRYPELQALAFWMRPAELARLRERFAGLADASTVLKPRGLVFHVPPANVDTIFVYSWLLSVLAGNHNLIRLSASATGSALLLARLLRRGAGRGAGRSLRGHGGDPVRPRRRDHAPNLGAGERPRDLGRRPDRGHHPRRSAGAPRQGAGVPRPLLDVGGEVGAVPGARSRGPRGAGRSLLQRRLLVRSDGVLVAAPHGVLWGGRDVAARRRAVLEPPGRPRPEEGVRHRDRDPTRQVRVHVPRGHRPPGVGLPDLRERAHRAHAGLDGGAAPRSVRGRATARALRADLAEIAPHLDRRDQTLSHWGFEAVELRAFVDRVNGAALDRLVPMGDALRFHRFWDGYDLLAELSRTIPVQA